MDLHDYLNVRRTFRMLAKQWGCPVWLAKWTVRRHIDQSWEAAREDPEAMQLRNKYFPTGKPTPEQYILRLGHAYERGDEMPYLLKKPE